MRSRQRLVPCATLLAALLAVLLVPTFGFSMGQRPTETPDGDANATVQDQNATAAKTVAPAPKPEAKKTPEKTGPDRDDASRAVQETMLRQYYQRMMTLDDRLPEVFSRRVREEETMGYLMMYEQQSRRGLLPRFRAARVYLEDLRFTRITADPDMARFRVRGTYSVSVGMAFETIEENALFVLLPEDGEWKIFERREQSD